MGPAFWIFLLIINAGAIALYAFTGSDPSWWTVSSACWLGVSVMALVDGDNR
jgi:hypothetical protein